MQPTVNTAISSKIGLWLPAFFALSLAALPAAAQSDVRLDQPSDSLGARVATDQVESAPELLLSAPDSTSLATAADQQGTESRQLLSNSDTAIESVEEDGVQRLEIDGLVVDETQSKLGRDFYELFYSGWQAPPDAFNFTVVVREQPMPNLGTRIMVLINDELAFQAQLQPRYDVIENMAQQAVAYTYRRLQNGSGSAQRFY